MMNALIKNITVGLQFGQDFLSQFTVSQAGDTSQDSVFLGVGAVMPNELSSTMLYEMELPRGL